jgi:hypothetical protein
VIRRLLLFVCALLLGGSAWAEGGPGTGQARAAWAAGRALPPTALPSIQSAFTQAPPWTLKSARIETSRLAGTACVSDSSCADFTLTDPHQGCGGRTLGQWCLTWIAARPTQAYSLEHALAAITTSVWIDPVGTDGEPSAVVSSAATEGSALTAWLIGLLLTFGPLSLGALLVRLLRRWRMIAALVIPIAVLAGALSLFERVPLSFWDLGWVGAFFGGGFLLGAFPPRFAPLLASMAVLALGLLVLEGLIRVGTREPATYPSASAAHLLFHPSQAEAACYAIDRQREPPWLEWRREGHIRDGVRVVHLGDSMVFGTRVEGHEAFVNELEKLEPGVAHVNFGVPYSSTDAQFVALLTWVDQVKPARVVLHFYAGNDIKEMDRVYPCCELGPFLHYETDRAVPRCTTPRWRFNAPTLIAEAPPPYVLRLATSFSWSARHSMEAFELASAKLSGHQAEKPPIEETVAWEHLELILKTLRGELKSRHVDFRLVVLPDRGLVESAHPEQEATDRIRVRALALARKLEIPALDPLPFLRELVARDGSPKFYVTPPAYEIHFNAEGHRRYAQWLHEKLEPPTALRP